MERIEKMHKGDLPVGFEAWDNAIKDCDKIIKFAEDNGFHSSYELVDGMNIVTENRQSKTSYIPMFDFGNPDPIFNMNKRVWQEMNEYATRWQAPFYNIEQVSIQRYYPGDEYHVHYDHGAENQRVISALVYLNTVEEGGETYFPEFDLKVKPVEGRLIIFPSNFIYRHAALTPEHGVKYAAAFWANG